MYQNDLSSFDLELIVNNRIHPSILEVQKKDTIGAHKRFYTKNSPKDRSFKSKSTPKRIFLHVCSVPAESGLATGSVVPVWKEDGC